MKASDIKDEDVLNYLAGRQGSWTSLWYGHFNGKHDSFYKDGVTPDVYNSMPKSTPEKVALAKMRSLYKRGLVGGCDCGCRGDFEITDKGLALVGRPRTQPYHGY